MQSRRVRLKQLEGVYAIARLQPDAALPSWADGPGFMTISRTEDELSVVCRQDRVPAGVTRDEDWTCLKFEGPFPFEATGIVLSVIEPLSTNEIGIFVVSTFDGDHLLLKNGDVARSRALLTEAGHGLG